MDDARRFRFLIPPFFLGLSFVVGLYFSGFEFENLQHKYSTEELVAIGALIGASVLPVGFVLTSLSILCLRVIWRVFGGQTYESYEIALSDETWDRVWPLLRTRIQREPRWHLYAGATFDHELLPPEIHEWSQRRWSTFNISAHSFTAVAVSHLAALHPAIHETWEWLLVTLVLLVIFGITAWIAWLQMIRMLEFQASREADVFQNR